MYSNRLSWFLWKVLDIAGIFVKIDLIFYRHHWKATPLISRICVSFLLLPLQVSFFLSIQFGNNRLHLTYVFTVLQPLIENHQQNTLFQNNYKRGIAFPLTMYSSPVSYLLFCLIKAIVHPLQSELNRWVAEK